MDLTMPPARRRNTASNIELQRSLRSTARS
jgi:hypothetical protein